MVVLRRCACGYKTCDIVMSCKYARKLITLLLYIEKDQPYQGYRYTTRAYFLKVM